MKKKEQAQVKDLMQFLDQSPTAFHAVEGCRQRLLSAGFTELKEKEEWQLTPGGAYFTVRNGSAMMAFVLPKEEAVLQPAFKGYHILAAHSDSPCFQIKEKPELKTDNQYIRLNVEGYGGMLIAPWFDRPLSIAGRVMVETKEGLQMRLLNVDRDLMIIPSLAIHMNREANNGYKYNIQQDCTPLYAMTSSKTSFEELVATELKIKKEEILGWNLYLYNRQKAALLGPEEELLASGRLDDLSCVYGGVKGLIDCYEAQMSIDGAGVGKGKTKKLCTSHIPVAAVFDNEEVGSSTKQGANSTFMEDTLYRIALCLGKNREGYLAMLADSFLISADNAHAVHPNQPQLSDPTNRSYLNGGIVLKFHGGQKYTTDAASAAVIRSLCKMAKLPLQTFANRSDMAGGSTLGNISTAHVSIPSADIGLPQLAMHSPYEVMGSRDILDLLKLCRTFFAAGTLL